MTKYKMLALDLDDTLLREDLTISEGNKQAIRQAIDKGVKVVIATGRMFDSALPYLKQLNLNLPVVSCQGAMVKSSINNEILYYRPAPLVELKQVIEECERENIYMQVYGDHGYFMNQDNEWSNMYGELTGVYGKAVGKISDFLDFDPLKLLLIDRPESIAQKHAHYHQQLQNKVNVFISKPFYLEFTNLEATKGHALTYLSEQYGITMDEVIAVGDSQNDIHMIEMAGLGVAVENARDEVKACAQVIAQSNENDGVAHVIKQYILEA